MENRTAEAIRKRGLSEIAGRDAIVLLALLCHQSYRNGKAWPAITNLNKMVYGSEAKYTTSIYRALKSLESHGWIAGSAKRGKCVEWSFPIGSNCGRKRHKSKRRNSHPTADKTAPNHRQDVAPSTDETSAQSSPWKPSMKPQGSSPSSRASEKPISLSPSLAPAHDEKEREIVSSGSPSAKALHAHPSIDDPSTHGRWWKLFRKDYPKELWARFVKFEDRPEWGKYIASVERMAFEHWHRNDLESIGEQIVLGKLNGVQILPGLDAYHTCPGWLKDDGRWRPHPLKWLMSESWRIDPGYDWEIVEQTFYGENSGSGGTVVHGTAEDTSHLSFLPKVEQMAP